MQVDLSGRAEKCALRWFGHVERMNNGRIAKSMNLGWKGDRAGEDQKQCG